MYSCNPSLFSSQDTQKKKTVQFIEHKKKETTFLFLFNTTEIFFKGLCLEVSVFGSDPLNLFFFY